MIEKKKDTAALVRQFEQAVQAEVVLCNSKLKAVTSAPSVDVYSIAKMLYHLDYKDKLPIHELEHYNPDRVYNQNIKGVIWPRILLYSNFRAQHSRSL